MTPVRTRFVLSFLCCAVLACPSLHAADEPAEVDLSQFYGFQPLEIYKLAARSGNLLAGDMNADGRTDLVIVDNSHSRIDVLLQRGDAPPPAAGKPSGVNAIVHDQRLEHRKIPVDKAIGSLAIGDFNHDGKQDLAYVGLPDRLIVRLQTADFSWPVAQSIRLADPQLSPWSISEGDLNGDGRTDLAVIGKHAIFVLLQSAQGTLALAERLMNTSEQLGLLKAADVDGDGRHDLTYLAQGDDNRAFCVRLQDAAGRLGPEMQFSSGWMRAVTIRDLDGKPGAEILSIQVPTGRLKIDQWERAEQKAGELGARLIQYGFGQPGSARERDLAIGDVTGDGLTDVVVTDPDGAQMLVYEQQKGTGLDQGHVFPGLLGAAQVRLAELNGRPGLEVLVISGREKSVAVSEYQDQRLSFPQPLPLVGEPVAIEIAELDGQAPPEVVVVTKERTGTKTSFSLKAWRSAAAETGFTWTPAKFGAADSVPLTLPGDPERFLALNAEGHGVRDFLLLTGSDRAPVSVFGSPEGEWTVAAGDAGLGRNVAAGSLSVLPTSPHELLVAQTNFARRLKLGENRQWRVVEQYNAAESSAKIAAATLVDLDGAPGDEIVLVDLGGQRLRILQTGPDGPQPWRDIEIGSFPFKSLHTADLNSDGRSDLVLFGGGKFGVVYAGHTDPRLKEAATYETRLERASYADILAGDVNGDGRPDLIAFDMQSQQVEILDYRPGKPIRAGLAFKVFEEKVLGGDDDEERSSGGEPREGVVADVTGDGRADLILLVHDRLLVYPQDAGGAAPAATDVKQ